MSARKMFKVGFLSMMAATGLFGAANGFAADGRTTNPVDGVTANTDMIAQPRGAMKETRAVSEDMQRSATPQQVVDAKGNVYLLIPLQTKEDKGFVGYTMPTSH